MRCSGHGEWHHNPAMARLLRLELPGVPLHVIQRGNNRAACFFVADDYRLYLDCLRRASAKLGCKVHAYVLMTNHVHLLVTPCEAHAVSRLMQWIGRRYVRTVNDRHERSGTLWEGRFRSTLVDSERYFLVCQQYIELNPVRAGMVPHPQDYRWSSHRHYAGGPTDPLVTEHDCYLALGKTSLERRTAYRQLFEGAVDQDLELIRSSTNRGWPLGSENFKDRIEAISGRGTRPVRRGRRRKENIERDHNQVSDVVNQASLPLVA